MQAEMGGGEGWYPGEQEPEDREDAQEAQDEDLVDDESGVNWAALRQLWAQIPEAEWTQERSDRIFAGIMARLERRQRWQTRFKFAAAAMTPMAVAAGIGALYKRLHR